MKKCQIFFENEKGDNTLLQNCYFYNKITLIGSNIRRMQLIL